MAVTPGRRNALLPPEPEMPPEIRLGIEFRVLVLTLGDKEARRLWEQAAKRKRGRPRGQTRPERDQEMLGYYDYLAPNPPVPIKNLTRWIGQQLHKDFPHQYGPSADAITTRLWLLLKKRKSAARAKAAKLSKMREEAAGRNLLLDAFRNDE